MPARRKNAPRARAAVVPFPARRAPSLGRLLPSGRSLAAGLALVGVTAAAYVAARESSLFAVQRVVVEGGTPAVAHEVRRALAPLLGESLVTIDAGAVVARAEAVPEVRAASLDRAFPQTLVLRIERELPVAVLRRGHESWLVSERARVLARLPRGAHPRLPRLWAPRSVALAEGALVADARVRRAARALAAVPEGFPVPVRAVSAADRDLVLKLAGGTELRLGSGEELALKLAVAGRVLPLVEPRSAGGPAYVDVGIPERPVAGGNTQVEG